VTSRPDSPPQASVVEPEGIDLAAIFAVLPTVWVTTEEKVVAVTGADRHSYLDAMSSQLMMDLPAGATSGVARSGMVLDPNGRTIVLFDSIALAEEILLLLPDEEAAAAAVSLLGGRTFLSDARFHDQELGVLRIYGPRALDLASEAFRLEGDPASVSVWETDDLIAARDPWGCVRIIGPDGALEAVIDRLRGLGMRQGSPADLDTWRVVVGRPAWGREVVAPHLPEELGLLPTHVHLAKGCYPGQEAVARMWMLGRPRRRLAVLAAPEDAFEAARSEDSDAAVVATTIASAAAIDDARGRTLALAMVPGSATVGSTVALGRGVSALVVSLPGDTSTPPGHDPAMRRRRDRDRGDGRPPSRLPAGPDPRDPGP